VVKIGAFVELGAQTTRLPLAGDSLNPIFIHCVPARGEGAGLKPLCRWRDRHGCTSALDRKSECHGDHGWSRAADGQDDTQGCVSVMGGRTPRMTVPVRWTGCPGVTETKDGRECDPRSTRMCENSLPRSLEDNSSLTLFSLRPKRSWYYSLTLHHYTCSHTSRPDNLFNGVNAA